jgi:hypothetical protein
MRLTDNKKYRNLRAQKEKYTARDRRESELGVDTGHTDMRGNPIMSGSIVLVYPTSHSSNTIWLSAVLWDSQAYPACYRALRGCWYGDKVWSDPRSHGKVEQEFRGKAGARYESVLVVGQLSGKPRKDTALIEMLAEELGASY